MIRTGSARALALAAVGLAGILVVAPAVSALGAEAQRTEDPTAARRLYSANGLLNRGLHELAAEEYRAFLAEHASHAQAPIAHYGLGVCLFRQQQFEEALTALAPLDGIADFEFAAEVAVMTGQSHLALDRPRAAAGALSIVLRDHLDHELADDAAVLQAEALYADGAYDEVSAPCQLLVNRWPQSPLRDRAELFRGLADIAREKYADAAVRFDAMLDRSPQGPYAAQGRLLLAQSLHRSDNVHRAVEEYRRVVEEARQEYLPDGAYGLAVALHQLDDVPAAAAVLEEHADTLAGSTLADDARLLRGRVAFDLGAYDEAIELLAPLREDGADLADDAAYWTAKSELREGRPGPAADRLAEALRAHPDSKLRAEMLFDRAVALLRDEQTGAADETLGAFLLELPAHELAAAATALSASARHRLEQYEQSLARCAEYRARFAGGDDEVTIAFLVAENEFLLRRYEAAVESYRAFLRDHGDAPQRDEAQYRIGMASYRLQRWDDAQTALEHVAAAAEERSIFRPALLALGDIAFQRGDWEASAVRFEEFLAHGSDQPSADEALLKLGLARHRQGAGDPAIEAYSRLLEECADSPHRTQALFERGQALVLTERDEEAARDFEAVVEADAPELRTHALNHLGAIAMRRQAYGEAAQRYARVAADAEDEEIIADARLQQGLSLMADGDFAGAEAVLGQLLDSGRAGPRTGVARAQRMVALSRQDKPEAALAAFDEIDADTLAALDAELRASVRYEQAWCLRAGQRMDEAAEAYRALLREKTRTALRGHATLELAELEADGQRYENAITLLTGLEQDQRAEAASDPELREQTLYRLGLYEYRLQRHRPAAEWLEAYLAAAPGGELAPSAHLLCGEALFELGAHDRAATHLETVTRDYREDEACGPALLRLGECLAAQQEWSRSREVFDRYLQEFPDSELWFQARFGVGWAMENLARHADAIEAYRPVADRHDGPTGARAQFQIGECLYALGRYEEAARALLKVDILFAYPQWSAAALYEAGRCFLELKDPVNARAQFEQVQQQYGETEWAPLAQQQLAELSRSALPGHE